jgi:hypothetical protein
MRSHTRFALAIVTLTSSFAASSAHAASAPGTPTGIDVIGTGKSVSQTWTPVSYDAQTLGLRGPINALNNDLASISSTNLSDVLGIDKGTVNLGTVPFGAQVDIKATDASALVTGTAYVNQPAILLGGSSMGVRAQAGITATLKVNAWTSGVAGNYNGNPIDLAFQPSAFAEASYVKPGSTICILRPGCGGTPAPYFHEVVTLRDISGNVLPASIDATQPSPLSFKVSAPTMTVPGPSAFSIGPVTFTPTLNVEALATASGSLDPTSGSLRLDLGAAAAAGLTADFGVNVGTPAGTVAGDAIAKVNASLLDGSGPLSNPWGHSETGAQAHATAYLYAGWSRFFGNQLCYGATGSLDAKVLPWSYDLSLNVSQSPIGSKTIDIYNDWSSGLAYSQAVTPFGGCIQL